MKHPPRKFVFFDLETAGIEEHHPITQIAAIAISDCRELETFERKIQFNEWQADPDALRLNSYDPDRWRRTAVNEAQAVSELSKFLRRHADIGKTSKAGKPYSVARLAGHNVIRFDVPRIKRAFDNHGEFLPADSFNALDTLHLANWAFSTNGHHRPSSYKLTVLAQHFGIPHDRAHDALIDVRITIQVAERLLSHLRGAASL